MSKWEMVRLGDILEKQPKSKIKAGEGLISGNYKFFTSSNTQTKFLNDYIYNEKSLIFGTGGNASIHYCEEPFSTSTDCLVFSTSNDDVLLKTIYLYIAGNMQLLEDGFKGAGLKHISQDYILNIEVPLMTFEEQNKIANELDKITSLIEKRKLQIEKLDVLIKAKFVEMFGDPVENPMGWQKDTLGNSLQILTDFSANGSYEYLDSNVKMYDEPKYALMVRTTDLEKKDFISDVKYVDENAYNILSKSKVYAGDIIMNKIGSAGKVYLMPKLDIPVTLGRNAFLMRLKGSVNNVFLYNLLTSTYGENEISQNVRGAVTKTITKDGARSVTIILPPIQLQNQFADYVQKVEQTKETLQKSLSQLETLYKQRMQEYFE